MSRAIVKLALIAVGLVVFLYGLLQFILVAFGLWGVFVGDVEIPFVGDATDVEMFETTLRFFLATTIGFVTVVLATYLEFDDGKAAAH